MDLLYPRAVAALNDDFETVRLEAIKLIWFDKFKLFSLTGFLKLLSGY
jgi:hypothetical protein